MALEKKQAEAKKESSRLLIARRTLELMTAAFALTAGLAWNDAIQSLFRKIFGEQSSLVAKFIYALLVTALIVLIGFRLSSLQKRIDERV
ncbi:MAG: DUF5654 family protein [bacterium]|nr:DUF5654 family protein [bacterium]